ncbi:ABC transporter substrate-binding protein [Aquibacillus albus]|uniref:Thiamine pyrimidine synthase n=1 Tax=Aquibacillus albus TaxID=1168171 RepID=A0ABS2N3H9_9BACI|nr:ABC transporter substrate-binding protein [Aquibacillus albus]MBM7572696.1 NitT/TauT family transport system substrate-binding protein [Aquibacillus albus]
MKRIYSNVFFTLILISLFLLLTACNQEAKGTSADSLEEVSIQLKWVPQAQFAGVYVADDKGFYEEEGIDIEIVPGGPDIVPEQQVANGVADVGITSLEGLLVNRDNGLPLQSIAQIQQVSSKYLIAKKSTGIDSPEEMKGKKVSTWMGGKQFPILAFMKKYGIDPENDIELVKQGFTMDQFLNDQVDVATAAAYNEYYVVLTSGMEESELNVFPLEDAGVGSIEDTLIASDEFVEENKDLAIRIVRATLKGWQYAIDNQDEAVDIVMDNIIDGSSNREHQEFMMSEMAKLIKPEGFTDKQMGMFVEESVKRTADLAYEYGLIEEEADLEKAINKSIYEEAVK